MKEANFANDAKMMAGADDQKEQKELKKMRSLLDILSNKIPPKVIVNLQLLEVREKAGSSLYRMKADLASNTI